MSIYSVNILFGGLSVRLKKEKCKNIKNAIFFAPNAFSRHMWASL